MLHITRHGRAHARSSTHRTSHGRLGVALAAAALAAAGGAQAAPNYVIDKTLVAQDEFKGPPGLGAKPLFKPHDARTSLLPRYWITSNERTGCAGITIFEHESNRVLAKLFIDDPAVAYPADESSSAGPCVGTVDTTPPPVEPPEGTPAPPPEQFPPEQRFSPAFCIPVVLPPGQAVVSVAGVPGVAHVKSPGAGLVCAPLGAEKHARHPHGITIDYGRQIAYQVIEHSGLRWNVDRTAFRVAETTDEESGMTVAYDISNPLQPKLLRAYLNGHGAHEVVVHPITGLVFQGNHEDSPGVAPPNWVDVINPRKANPYGFIDTGYYNAIQGLDTGGRSTLPINGTAAWGRPIVYGATHVGEKIFAFDGNCEPQPTPAATAPPPAPPGYAPPAGSTGLKMGWNCVLWWTDIRAAFLAANPHLAGMLTSATPPSTKPNVLHQHNLASDHLGRAFSAIHSIHDAEHTGLDDEEVASGTEEEGAGHHFMGRWVVAAGLPRAIDAVTKKADTPLEVIDLSNGYDVLAFPNAEDVQARAGLQGLMRSFVHAHFLWVDVLRGSLLVSGEHTGNLGVVDLHSRRLTQVIPISRKIPGCVPPPPVPGAPPEPGEEPHVHGVTVQPLTGTVYVSDEGEHCFYESVTILKPRF